MLSFASSFAKLGIDLFCEEFPLFYDGVRSSLDKNSILQILGYALALPGVFLFLLGIFSGPIQTGELLNLDSWTAIFSFYSGMGFVIVGSVLLSTAGSMRAQADTDEPALVGQQKLSGKRRLSHFPIDLGTALVVGVVVSAANTFALMDIFNSSSGLPFQVKSPDPSCFGPFRMGGCFTFNQWALLLDGVVWTGLAFVTIALADILATSYVRTRLASVAVRKINQ